MLFDASTSISYDNDDEYRVCLGKIFGLISQSTEEEEDDKNDEEMKDTTIVIISQIYESTFSEPHFSHLYRRGATFIFSDDPELGIPFMFSYSCLAHFWELLSIFSTKQHFNIEGHDEQRRFEELFNELNKILDDLDCK
jgi:hypothetical protein